MLTYGPAPVDLYKLMDSARRKEPGDEKVEIEKIKRLSRITVCLSTKQTIMLQYNYLYRYILWLCYATGHSHVKHTRVDF